MEQEKEKWLYRDRVLYSQTLPHQEAEVSFLKKGSIWKKGHIGERAFVARYTSCFDCGVETDWWYCIKDTPYDIDTLNAKKRYEIVKARRNFRIEKVDPTAYIDEMFAVLEAAHAAYPAKYRPQTTYESFSKEYIHQGGVEWVVAEFDAHPDADIFIFHLDTDSERKQVRYSKTKKCGPFTRMPWGGLRVAVRLNSIKKANVWFTSLFGGGCLFPSGEDSMWLADAKKKGLTFYVSKETIGKVSFEDSSWFTGYDEKFFFGKGAWCQAVHSRTFVFWSVYYAWRYRNSGNLTFSQKRKWMSRGRKAYAEMISFEELGQGKC